MNSPNNIVRSVVRQVLSMPSERSILFSNFVNCCKFFNLSPSVPCFGFDIDYVKTMRVVGDWTRFVDATEDKISFLFELIMMRDNVWPIESGCLANEDIKFLIYNICT